MNAPARRWSAQAWLIAGAVDVNIPRKSIDGPTAVEARLQSFKPQDAIGDRRAGTPGPCVTNHFSAFENCADRPAATAFLRHAMEPKRRAVGIHRLPGAEARRRDAKCFVDQSIRRREVRHRLHKLHPLFAHAHEKHEARRPNSETTAGLAKGQGKLAQGQRGMTPRERELRHSKFAHGLCRRKSIFRTKPSPSTRMMSPDGASVTLCTLLTFGRRRCSRNHASSPSCTPDAPKIQGAASSLASPYQTRVPSSRPMK